MQSNQASGLDTKAMLPIFTGIYMIIAELFLPWFSMPFLKFSKLPEAYSLWHLNEALENFAASIGEGSRLDMPPLTNGEMAGILQAAGILKIISAVLVVLLVIAVISAYKWKYKSAGYVRFVFLLSTALPISAFVLSLQGNQMINERAGRVNDFLTLTVHSYLQLSSYAYAQLILGVLMFFVAGKLLNTQFEYAATMYMERSKKVDNRIGRRTKVSIFLILIAIPAMIFFGIFFLNNRSDSFIALCIIGLAMIPFAMVFEDRKPQAREILLIAVMATIAVVGRMAFFMIPQFKPVTAIVIITGIGLGPEAGFLTGAVAGFVSNFFFGQGPWTPWQMFSFGIIGFLAGLIFRGKRQKYRDNRLLLCLYGGIATLVIYGLLMDTSSVTTFGGELNWESFKAMYISGFPFNVIHGISTMVFLFFLAKPMNRKLDRIKKKYGILEA